MATLKRSREKWENLVDSVESGGQEAIEVPDDVLEYVESRRAQFEAAARERFQPQMTPEEACRAQPLKTNTADNLHGRDVAAEAVNFVERLAPVLKATHLTAPHPERIFIPAAAEALVSEATAAPKAQLCVKRRADFMPIILVPHSASAALQIFNIEEFVSTGRYVDPTKKFIDPITGSANRRDADSCVIAKPGNMIDLSTYRVKFRSFKFVDDPSQVDNWDHVCACIVTGATWQFDGWFNGNKQMVDPSILFSQMRGFLPHFEEDKPAPQRDQWNVVTLHLTRKATKAGTLHLRSAVSFWEEVYKFLDSNPRFRTHTLPSQTAL